MVTITLWTNGPACMQCYQTKREFDRRGIIYRERDLRRNPKAVQRFQEMGLTATPIVETDDRRWSGFRLEKIKGLEQYLKIDRMRGKSVPLQPIVQVADEVTE